MHNIRAERRARNLPSMLLNRRRAVVPILLAGIVTASLLPVAVFAVGVAQAPAPDQPFSVEAIEAASLDEAMELIEGATTEQMVDLFNELTSGKAADMMEKLNAAAAVDVMTDMASEKGGAIFEAMFTDSMTEIVTLMPEKKLEEMLPEVSAQKLWEMPLQLLIDKLPGVPVMHLDFWIRPEVDPDLPAPVSDQIDPTLVEYTVPETVQGDWALVVGSPTPFDKVWAKFNRPLANVRFNIQDLDQRPAGTTELPPGRIPSSFLKVDVMGADPEDIAVVATIVSVDTSFISANDVHKWSIAFNRFDRNMNSWVPFPSKRIDENEERVLFAVILPGFSELAITGSKEIPQQVFVVENLFISPSVPSAGEETWIGATVTNTGAEDAVFPANLWLDNTIEATQAIELEPGEQRNFVFGIRKPEGTYKVRVDRLLSEFTVGTDQGRARALLAAAPATGDTTPPPLATAAAGILFLVLGLTVLRMSHTGRRTWR